MLLTAEKRVTPIEKVIRFMKDREYRTSELFRALDKDASRNLTCDELASRMLVSYLYCYVYNSLQDLQRLSMLSLFRTFVVGI